MIEHPAFAPVAGMPVGLADDLMLVLAPNPSPMTFLGTNSYVLGTHQLAIIDPGPDDLDHLAALLAVIDGRDVTHILLTHSHLDHSPLAHRLRDVTGASIHAFGDSHAGRSTVMAKLAQNGLTGGGEGIDLDFKPDVCLADSHTIVSVDWQITALHTPGHIGNHLCFQWGDAVFTGDHIMGWSTSLVSPPDGDITDFMRSCARLQQIPARIYYPGHGAPVTDPHMRLSWLVQHRRQREAQIMAALGGQGRTVSSVTKQVYSDIAQALLPAAERNVFAHLIDLVERGDVVAQPALGLDAQFRVSRVEID